MGSSKMGSSKMGSIWARIKGFLYPESTSSDIVSNNAKIVLYGLFMLIGGAVLMYAITVGVAYNPKAYNLSPEDKVIAENEENIRNSITKRIINSKLTDEQKLQELQEHLENSSEYLRDRFQERFQQMEQLDAVYIAAISGAIALGGTLISQVWGRRQQ